MTLSHPFAPVVSRLDRTRRRAAQLLTVGAVTAGLVMALQPTSAFAAQAPINLHAAKSFAVLAGAGITNTGATTITGDVGTFATTSETGFNTVTLLGVDHAGDAVTQQAKTDLTTAYNVAAGRGPAASVATELGGRTLTPGVYHGATLGITGTLTLDTQGDPNAVFILQASSTLITASGSSVVVLGGATACNVFWQVGSSATLGTTSHLIGTVMASESITATTGATVQGRLLAQTSAVTLDHNTITRVGCAAATTTTTVGGNTSTTTGGSGGNGGGNGGNGGGNGGGTPTTVAGSGGTTIPSGGSSTGVTTPAGRSRIGLTTSSATPPTTQTARPPLAFTGFNPGLALIGTSAVGAGLVLLRLSSLRRRQLGG